MGCTLCTSLLVTAIVAKSLPASSGFRGRSGFNVMPLGHCFLLFLLFNRLDTYTVELNFTRASLGRAVLS